MSRSNLRVPRILLPIVAIALLLTTLVINAPAQSNTPDDEASSITLTADGDAITTGEAFLKKVKDGGKTMIFIVLVSVIAVASTLERLFRLRLKFIAPPSDAVRMEKLVKEGQFEQLKKTAASSNSTLGRTILAMLRHNDLSKAEIGDLAGDVAARDMKLHMIRAYPLMICATISPLLGLFGTVIGMIGAFGKVAAAGDLADASIFGGDISKALVTTAAGLMVAIPALGAYHFFRNRTNLMTIDLEEQLGEILAYWHTPADSAKNGGSPNDAN